jgi:Major Facilitator Superfamily
MNSAISAPGSAAAIREALLRAREPPPAPSIAGLASYRWLVVGTVCIGAFMGQVDSSITQLLLPKLESEFDARLSTVSWVAVAYLLAMAAFLPIFGRLADILGRKLLYTAPNSARRLCAHVYGYACAHAFEREASLQPRDRRCGQPRSVS